MASLPQVDPPPAGTVSSSRLESVEVLRGLAAFAVMWFHFTLDTGNGISPLLAASGSYGWLGVSLFFVVSGFILPFAMHAGGYRFPEKLGTFVVKRLVRLEPPYLVSVLLAAGPVYLFSVASGHPSPDPLQTPERLFQHIGYLNGFFATPWVNPVYWSLAIEIQFYLLLALLYPLFLGTAKTRAATLALFLVSAFLIPSDLLVFHWAPLFAIGIVTFWAGAGMLSARGYVIALLASATAAIVTLGLDQAMAGTLGALFIRFVQMPRVAVLSFLGSISYSIYLLHIPVWKKVGQYLPPFSSPLGDQLINLVIVIAVTLAAAFVLHVTVERPCQRLSAKLRYRPRIDRTTGAPAELALSPVQAETTR